MKTDTVCVASMLHADPADWKFASPTEPGLHAVVTPGNSPCRAIRMFRLNLQAGQRQKLGEAGLEFVAGMVAGAIELRANGNIQRLTKLDAFYLPGGGRAEVVAQADSILYLGAAAYEGVGEFLVQRYDPTLPLGEVHQIHGKGTFEREVFMALNPERPASRLIAGWTFGQPGGWTSWPPHQHELDLEEVYAYFDIPPPSFGLHLSYCEPGAPDAVHMVRSGDMVIAPHGYHPTVAMPGQRNCYFWVLAAHSLASRRYDLAVLDPMLAGGGVMEKANNNGSAQPRHPADGRKRCSTTPMEKGEAMPSRLRFDRFRPVAALLTLALYLTGTSWAQTNDAAYTLPVEQAVLLRAQTLEPAKPVKDAFGPGLDGVGLYNVGQVPSQLRWTCEDIPAGDYFLELPVVSSTYLGFGETIPGRLLLYQNDTLLAWQGYTYPTRLTGTAASGYAASLFAREAIHLKPGDLLRVEGGHTVVGALRLHRNRPQVDVEPPATTALMPLKTETRWLDLDWEATRREGDQLTQSCWLFNPGAKPLTVHLQVEARDYLQTPLLDKSPSENPTRGDRGLQRQRKSELEPAVSAGFRISSKDEIVVIPPCERISKTFSFSVGSGGRTRLSLAASADGFFPTHYRAKYFLDDITTGPRPRTSLNGAWDMCYVVGVEPGDAPPADASWTPCVVPKLQENKRGHCMWFRRAFASPAPTAGERMVIRFGMVLSESWLYVNGTRVHHQFDGAEPFEADVTDAWKPGATNELLLAVRDWIAYSPANRARLSRGENLIEKDGMIAPSGYQAFGAWGGCMGMGEPVHLEARPAVSVDDVCVTTTLRDRKLQLAYRVSNKSADEAGVVLAPVILDAGRELARLDAQSVRIAPGATAAVNVEAPWPDGVKLWQPGAPHLYVLRTDLTGAAGTADQHLQRFGFRDIRMDGIHFVVNGVRMKIRSSWASSASGIGQGRAYAELDRRLETVWECQMRNMGNGDIQLSRTHNATGVRDGLDVADETGLMIKVENGSICQQAFTFDTEYWKNALASEVRMVELYRNHPSAWMWSAGNENMWGWLYQGEKIRDEGNRRQLELARAMRAADPQERPIEWEADGDLLGKWEYHQLHYPRELARSPDVPVSAWWGPLDGKTVVPYSMGPITLGQKPITEGEAFWPVMLAPPYGGTILFGDKALEGGRALHLAWAESSQHFVNGFRDAEFALIDTYTPLALVRPQAVVLKEETAAFYGGRTVVRGMNVHNDVAQAATLTLQWSLTAADGKSLDHGREKLALGPAELKRLEIAVRLPKVAHDTPATLAVSLLDAHQQVVHSLSRPWVIAAPPTLRVPPALKLHIFDPQGDTAAALASNGVPFTALSALAAPTDGGTLMLGRGALASTAPGDWRKQLTVFVRDGGKLVVLSQAASPEFLPFPVTLAPKQDRTIAFVRAADHPVMRGCTDDQLRWWADDHYVSRGVYRKPLGGNVISLVDVGTVDGLVESALMEEYLGRGSILLCQMPLLEKAATAPAAGCLLQNLLDYLASPAVFRQPGKTALLAGTNEALRAVLTQSRLEFDSLNASPATLDADTYRLAIIDVASALDDATATVLKSFAEAGGTVLLHRARPDQQAMLESLLGVGLTFTDVATASGDVQYRVLRRGQGGLLDGLSNQEFLWASKPALQELRKDGRWYSVLSVPPQEFVADYFCNVAPADAGRVRELTHPCALLAVPHGKGAFVLSQFRLDEPVADVADTVSRLRALLLTNLGGTIQARAAGTVSRTERLKRFTFHPVSLDAYANRGLKDDKDKGIVGWTNQGDNDMRCLPTGEQAFAEVPFRIGSPKSVITLYSTSGSNRDLPKAVTNIVVQRQADALFFLHGMAWGGAPQPFLYRVHYADGTAVEVLIHQGRQVFDWFDDANRHTETMAAGGTVVGFSGDNAIRKGVNVLLYEWANPHPDKVITGIDFARAGESFDGVPVLVGITAAARQSDQGVVTEVVGLRGVKVQLGTQLVEVDYIGVDALNEKDPFYGEALAAHKVMVVGKRVLLQDDAVAVNEAGRRLAYVFLDEGDGIDLRNLVNARLVGDGLSRLGNFEGNNRYRMYFENLAFISSQSKKGLWGVKGP